jgi:hypothetical protein
MVHPTNQIILPLSVMYRIHHAINQIVKKRGGSNPSVIYSRAFYADEDVSSFVKLIKNQR